MSVFFRLSVRFSPIVRFSCPYLGSFYPFVCFVRFVRFFVHFSDCQLTSILSHFVSVSLHFVPFCVHSVRFHVRFVSVRSTFYREKDKTDSDIPDCPFSCSFYPFVSFCVRFVRISVGLVHLYVRFVRIFRLSIIVRFVCFCVRFADFVRFVRCCVDFVRFMSVLFCPFVRFCVRFLRFCVRFVRYVSLIRVRLPFYRETDKTNSDNPSNKYAISLT